MQAPYRRVAIMHMADLSGDHAGGMQLRLLGSVRELDGGELPDLYGYPAGHNGVWLRANFISSLDGGATFGGTTGQLGGPGDRAVFSLLRELADVIDCSFDDPTRVDEAALLATLADRGLPRVLTEGGPMLFSSFIERDMLDELCLTIAPTLVGGQAGRIATGPGQVLTGMHCAHILTDEKGYLYTRYVKG